MAVRCYTSWNVILARHSQSAAAPYMQGQAITDFMHKLLHKSRDYNRETRSGLLSRAVHAVKSSFIGRPVRAPWRAMPTLIVPIGYMLAHVCA
jgi:hypothetical protein